MIPGVVLTAGQPENNSAVTGMVAETAEATDSRGKCILLFVPLAAKVPRYPSSPERGDRCTAPTATQKRGGRDKGSS
jgi:hypothetical protein